MLLTTLLLALAPALPQAAKNASGGELRADQAGWDVLHYRLELEVDPARKHLRGSSLMRARALEQTGALAVDLAPDFEVERAAVLVDGRPRGASHAFEGGRLRFEVAPPLPAGQLFEVAVDYAGEPRVAPQPPWKGGFTWARTRDGSPWIATSCQGEGADLWWPCKDHPSDKPDGMDLLVTVPEGLFCASNGVLVSDTTVDGSRTQHWRVTQPIANYAVALNIAPYEVLERQFTSVAGDTFGVSFWHLPENAEQAAAHFDEFLDHLRHLESVCGPYPFRGQKYGIVETPHLGMEHQTIIAYGNRYRGGPDGFDWLHHHELSHEWWANLVTCSDWKDMWIHEGFGTYMQALYAEERKGPAGLQKFMRRIRAQLGNRKAVAPRESKDSQEIYFDTRGRSDSDIYYKGAWVLHTLRWHMGDEPFFRLLRRFAYPTDALEAATDGSQVRFVDTEDFRALAESIHGEDLGWFFEVYLRQGQLPALEAKRDGDRIELSWSSPVEGGFPLDVPVRVGERVVRVEVDEHGRGALALEAGAERPEIDPDGWLLRR